jgi:hypothetical protein
MKPWATVLEGENEKEIIESIVMRETIGCSDPSAEIREG